MASLLNSRSMRRWTDLEGGDLVGVFDSDSFGFSELTLRQKYNSLIYHKSNIKIIQPKTSQNEMSIHGYNITPNDIFV